MSTGLIVSIVVVVIIVVLIGWGVSAYNNLVTLKNRVKNGWAQIDVQLKQRADLIPNLVNTVKGYASHESEVFTQVDRRPRRRSGCGQQPEHDHCSARRR